MVTIQMIERRIERALVVTFDEEACEERTITAATPPTDKNGDTLGCGDVIESDDGARFVVARVLWKDAAGKWFDDPVQGSTGHAFVCYLDDLAMRIVGFVTNATRFRKVKLLGEGR